MKRILLLLAICASFAVTGFTQPVDSDRNHRLLNATELRNEPWFYSLDEALANPSQVYKLSLTDQKLKELPMEISQLTNLQVLNLSNCGLKALPVEIKSLKKVQMISLYGNKLKNLPDEFRELRNLEVLYLGSNKIPTLPIWVGGMGKLRRLDISRNPITPQELMYIRNMMPRVDVTW